MLKGTNNNIPKHSKDDVLRSALVESFLIHFRNLRSFLRPGLSSERNPDKAIAVNYTSGDWNPIVTSSKWLGNDVNQRINRTLAHITSENWSEHRNGDKRWDVGEMSKEILNVVDQFRDQLSADWNKDWLDRDKIRVEWDEDDNAWLIDLI